MSVEAAQQQVPQPVNNEFKKVLFQQIKDLLMSNNECFMILTRKKTVDILFLYVETKQKNSVSLLIYI